MLIKVVFLLLFTMDLVSSFKLGIENCISQFPLKTDDKKIRIGLIANQTSCDQEGNRTVDLLLQHDFKVTVLLVTEHGVDGTIPALQDVGNSCDTATKIPVVSLYSKKFGSDRFGLVPESSMQDVDCLIFDLQDAGMRHFTYIDTLLKALQSAARHNKPIIVCDRPNLLGYRMEGPPGNPRIFKQETIGSLPLRHGMTTAEIARYFNECVLQKKAELYIAPMSCYERTMDAGHHYKNNLSPNICSINAVHGYSFLGVLGEVRPFDLGIGSDKAFQCILLPDEHAFTSEQWAACKQMLSEHGIEGSDYRYFSTRKKKWYRGLQISINNIAQFRSFETLIDVLEFFKNNQVQLTLSSYFDTAVGNARIRLWLDGKLTKEQVVNSSKDEVRQFFEKSRNQFLYQPLPQIVHCFGLKDIMIYNWLT